MGTKYIENTGRDTIYVGGKMILPGEGRDIDSSLLPAELQGPAEVLAVSGEPSLAELLGELRAKSVKVIIGELANLTHEGLDLLADQEGTSTTPRSSLLGAIKAEQLRRAQSLQDEEARAAQAEFDAKVKAAYDAALAKLTPEELKAIGEEDKAALRVQAEESVRAAADAPPAA